MTEFINNMTHEFKTPISTVALASEAIMRDDVIRQKDKVDKYNRMIRDENQRMRRQVDRILQMAVLEEGDYELNLENIDIHEIITRASQNTALHVEHNGGEISHSLEARNSHVKADRVHLENIIHNLLDNAGKYSGDTPKIQISSFNTLGGIAISIKDHGIGMSEKDCRLAFEKYYRVYTGNVHNVKGFGLGLSYVKLMVTAMNGRVRLRSKLAEGTEVELFFPVSDHEDLS